MPHLRKRPRVLDIFEFEHRATHAMFVQQSLAVVTNFLERISILERRIAGHDMSSSNTPLRTSTIRFI